MARRRITQRQRRATGLARARTLDLIAIQLFADAQDFDEELCALAVAALAIQERRQCRDRRYGPRGAYDQVKLTGFFDLLFQFFPDRFFKSWIRMDRKAFWHIHDLICDDPIFQSSGRRPQLAVKYQLATFYIRSGAEDEVKVATVMGISEGAAYKYVDRACKALRRIRDNHLGWPGEHRREYISRVATEVGFPGATGAGDASYFRLGSMPRVDGYSYFCRKKFYAIILQATVDFRGRFTSYDFGWPGSVQDSRVFKLSHLWTHREEYFREHEYILVDKGYPLTHFSIRPFNDYDLSTNEAEAARRREWNQRLSSLRVFVEHAFGRLKGRFPILRCIPCYDMNRVYRTVEALMVTHNILEGMNDDPAHISGFNGLEDDDVLEVVGEAPQRLDDVEGDDLYRVGLLRRKELLRRRQ